ncbi:multiplied multi-transmembrane transporter-like protein [Babesia gibsoni]|uniref:Multiplied multi-transmembrane transporter-like protein n=1 Tax=Babesia gibsoni TaxID=33632 RepID=A0AAD8PEW7_BABGI|nr:multiplied multi-transmembrane transporter-like protein [Babesia gibsoni]
MEEEKRIMKHYGPLAFVLYHAVAFLNAYDTQLLPICMRAFEVSLGLSPSSLSILATVELMTIMGVCPFWGVLVDLYKCNYVQSASMVVNGLICILLGCASSYPYMVFLRIMHGFVLSSLAPVMHKIITDSRSSESQGTYYSINYGVYCVGRIASFYITSTLAMKSILGYCGWRFCYIVMGCAWLIVGVLVYFYMRPTDDTPGVRIFSADASTNEQRSILESTLKILKTGTFWILVVVMIAGDTPFAMLVYMVLYFQYSGLSDVNAGVATATVRFGAVVGSFAGGYVIDACHKLNKKYGRIGIGTSIVVVRLVSSTILLSIPIVNATITWHHYIELILLGATLVITPGIERPVLAAVVPIENQGLALSLIRVIGGMPSYATFVPLIGFMAERAFGYTKTKELVENMEQELRDTNATALRKSMLYVMVVSTIITIISYIGLLFTYPKDARKENVVSSKPLSP